jgi:hypothetical protein
VLSPQNFFNTQQLGKKEKNKQTNLPKKYQLRRTRKPTNPNSSANTERGVLPMFCCKGAKGYQGLQTSSSREKTKATNRVVKTPTGWMESAELSAENHPWAVEMEGNLFPLLFRAQNLRFLIIYSF